MKFFKETLRVNLYGTLEFENFEQTDSAFDARNIEFLLDFRASQRFRIFGEIEFERTAKTGNGNRHGEVEVEQGWIKYGINRYINPRFGVILVPFGRYTEPNAQFTENIRVKTSDEIGKLAESFNDMARVLQDHNKQLNDSYHELERANKELKDTHDQLVQAGKMAAIGQLAAGVSHELNNPLGGILGYS